MSFNSDSGCFIATASFGSPLAGDVKVLCSFRDSYLMKEDVTRMLVGAYYYLSPGAARFIRGNSFVSALVRFHLKPFIKAAKIFLN